MMAIIIPNIEDALWKDAHPLIGESLIGTHHLDEWYFLCSKSLRDASLAHIDAQAVGRIEHIMQAHKRESLYCRNIEGVRRCHSDGRGLIVESTTIVSGMVHFVWCRSSAVSIREVSVEVR